MTRIISLPGLLIGAVCLCIAMRVAMSSEISPQEAIALGARLELFVDDFLIASKQNVTLRLMLPERREIVLVTDKPWEGPASAYFTVIQDADRIRLYYRGFCDRDDSELQVTCYAESRDGIHFTRPDLNLFAFNGSRKNNIVWQGVESHNFAPFLDTNPAAKPGERFKALGGLPPGGLYAFISADGIHWKKMQPEPVMAKGTFDSLNIAFWDETAKRYRCYSRYFDQNGVRAIQHSVSRDFVHWEEPEPNRYSSGAPAEHFYTNATRPCPDAPHLYLSFPMRFVPQRTKMPGYPEPGVSDAVFMSSRDGSFWDRRFLEAWARPGLDQRNWTQRSNMPAAGIIATGQEEYSLYITEHYDWQDHRLRRLTVRRNGFASVHADAEGGEFVTHPITFNGSRLRLNYATSAVGSVAVEIQDAQGRPLPGYALEDCAPLFGDELSAVVRWKGGEDLAPLVGRTVRLRFVLRDADLYALQFKTGDQ
jgi:hypothetical protein